MKVGDKVIRMLAGSIEMVLHVTELTEDIIQCGPWKFDRATGGEIDEDLDWGAPPLGTGSFIRLPEGDSPYYSSILVSEGE